MVDIHFKFSLLHFQAPRMVCWSILRNIM
uniref:Uncharacterized protein n=1 Tax=Rhizophora mucronata TaxID=61149 RepID=A0A2P2QI98_RHIMU